MLRVYRKDTLPSNVRQEVLDWQDSKRSSVADAAIFFALPDDDILVFSDCDGISAVGLLQIDVDDSVMFGLDMLYLAFFATRKSGYGRDCLQAIVDYAHNAGFELGIVSLQTSIGFYQKMPFLTQEASRTFVTVQVQ